ncbi:MAG: VCBS repeat-containing protein [Dysgonamonadaceae bacterium]|jgi:hypothetical protein|nr:VCBS repeat-containing protein [Dysgonamonadaceae bacterium]
MCKFKFTVVLFSLLITVSAFGQTVTDNDFSALWGSSITIQAPGSGGIKPKDFNQIITADFNEDGYADMLSVFHDYDYENVVALFLGQSDLNAITPVLIGGENESFELGAMATLDVLKIAPKKYLVAMTGGVAYDFLSDDYTTDTKSVLYELDCTGAVPVFTKKQDLDNIGIRWGGIFFFDGNNDGKEDILILGLNKVYLNNGDNTFAAGQEVTLPFIKNDSSSGGEVGNKMWIKAHKADLNGDGKMDIIATQAGAGGLKVISVIDGTPTLTELNIPHSVAEQSLQWTSCAVGDLNGDGFIDIVAMNVNRIVDPWHFEMVVYLNDGKGGFTEKVQSPLLTGTQASIILIYDYNGDGKNDIFHAGWNARTHSWDPENNNFDTKSFVCLNKGGGTFEEYYSSFGANDCPSLFKGGGCLADLNNDGKMDMILAEGNIRIWSGLIENVFTAGVKPLKPLEPNVFAGDHSIYIKNVTGTVNVFDICGRCIANVNAVQETSIPVSQGLYFVSAGNQVTKVIVK